MQMALTLSRKLLGGFAIVLFILIAIVSLAFFELQKTDDTYVTLLNTQVREIIAVRELQDAQKLQTIGMDSILINKNEDALKFFDSAAATYAKKYDAFVAMADEPGAIKISKDLKVIDDNFDKFVTDELFPQAEAGNNAAVTQLLSTKGSALFGQFDSKIAELSALQEKVLQHDIKAAMDNADAAQRNLIILGSIASVLGILLALVIARLISKPVEQISKAAKEIANGNLAIAELRIKNKDEVGELATSFNQMRINLRDILERVSHSSVQVNDAAKLFALSADQATQASENIVTAIQQIADGSDQQHQSTEEISHTIDEMSKGAQQIASNSEDVAHTSIVSAEKAAQGGKAIQTAVDQMNAINETFSKLSEVISGLGRRSNEIGNIIEVITGISAQTNLLALNAAIEAARAGEAGRGFSVVAGEVRKLAEQSATSAQQVSQLVTIIQQETQNAMQSMMATAKEVVAGIEIVHTAGSSFGEIQSAIHTVTTQIQEVASAVHEMAAGTDNIVVSIRRITEISETVAASTEETSSSTEEQLASMEEITSSATALSTMATDLQLLIQRFKL